MKKFIIPVVILVIVLIAGSYWHAHKTVAPVDQPIEMPIVETTQPAPIVPVKTTILPKAPVLKTNTNGTVAPTTFKALLDSQVNDETGKPITQEEKDQITKIAEESIVSTLQFMTIATDSYFEAHTDSYGASATDNVCFDYSDNGLKELSKSLSDIFITPTCAVTKIYPAKTFTVTIPSVIEKGMYCTDQKGYQGFISSATTVKTGISCK